MNLTRSSPRGGAHPLAFLAGAFALGIVIPHFSGGVWWPWAAGAVAAGCAALALRERRLAAVFLAAAFAGAGGLAYQLEKNDIDPTRVRTAIDSGAVASGDPVEIGGKVIAAEPVPDGIFLTVAAGEIIHRGEARVASGSVRMFAAAPGDEAADDYRAMAIRPGDRIRTICRLLREDAYLNPGVPPRRELMDRMGIDASCAIKSPLLIEITQRGGIFGNPFSGLRYRLIEKIRETFAPQTAGLLIAATQGNKYFLDRETAEVFRDGGTFHILVISGLHITLIGGLILALVRAFTRKAWIEFAVTTGVLWGLTMAVGGGAPAVRASIMFSIVLFARVIHRDASLLNSLGAGALMLLVWEPADLFDPSFQLTFASMSGIVGLAFPIVTKCREIGSWTPTPERPFPAHVSGVIKRACEWLYWNPRRWEIEESRQVWSAKLFKPMKERSWQPSVRRAAAWTFEGVVVSVSVQIWLVPLMAYYFHRVTPGSILLNLWVGPLLAAEGVAALLALAASQAGEAIGMPFVVLTESIHAMAVWLPAVVTDFEFATWRVPVYSGWLKSVYGVYLIPVAVLSAAVFTWKPFALRRREWRRYAGSAGAGLALALGAVIILHPGSAPRAEGVLRVDMLDVGQGDATLITFPNGETMLVDGGGTIGYRRDDAEDFERDSFRVGEGVVSEYLWERGYSKITTIVATHADADHIQGLVDVARNFKITRAVIPSGLGVSADGRELMAALEGVQTEVLAGVRQFEVSGVSVTMLAAEDEEGLSENDRSIVIRLNFGERAFLLTGDIEQGAEQAVLAKGMELNADVIKVAHHGSRTSSTEEFVNAAGAKWAIIPVGRRSRFGHPHAEVVERWESAGAEVLTTGWAGTITITTDGSDLNVQVFLGFEAPR
jgi:competence protein ComEC